MYPNNFEFVTGLSVYVYTCVNVISSNWLLIVLLHNHWYCNKVVEPFVQTFLNILQTMN